MKFFLIAIFLILLLPSVLSLAIRNVPNAQQPSLDGVIKIYGDKTITQKIVQEKDNFSGIGISIKNPNLINKKDIVLSVFQNDTKLREVKVNGSSISDGKFVKFLFEPITASKTKEFSLVFSAPEANKEDTLELFYSKQDSGWSRELIVDEIWEVGNLSLVTYSKPGNPLLVARDIYLGFFTRLFADLPFSITYTLILTLLCGYLISTLRSKS